MGGTGFEIFPFVYKKLSSSVSLCLPVIVKNRGLYG